MNWKKVIGYGVLIWIVMFAIVSFFIALNIYGSTFMEIVIALIGGVVVYVMAGRIKIEKAGTALAYGFSWMVVGVILDWIITTHFNPAIFSSWTMWFGYALGVLAPLLRVKKSGPASTGNETV